MKKYLSLGVVLAGSALMISCDDTGDDVYVSHETGVADAIADLGSKPVAPVPLAVYPLTSLKLAFDEAAGGCAETAFEAGDEIELDFDTIDVLTGNAQADLDVDGTTVFGQWTNQGYVANIVNSENSFSIAGVYAGTGTDGELLLSDLTFIPLASDLRSVTGSFSAVGTEEATVDQNTTNVVGNNGALSGTIQFEGEPVNSITFYQDAEDLPLDIFSFSNELIEVGAGANDIVSISYGDDCELLFVVATADTDGLYTPDGIVADNAALETFVGTLDIDKVLVLSPLVDNISAAVAEPLHLITGGNGVASITGSYRHDYDSSVGTAETIINNSAIDPHHGLTPQ